MAIAASLLMGLGAAFIYAFSARRDYFQDLEETKYQVFWSDLEELVDSGRNQQQREEPADGDESAAG